MARSSCNNWEFVGGRFIEIADPFDVDLEVRADGKPFHKHDSFAGIIGEAANYQVNYVLYDNARERRIRNTLLTVLQTSPGSFAKAAHPDLADKLHQRYEYIVCAEVLFEDYQTIFVPSFPDLIDLLARIKPALDTGYKAFAQSNKDGGCT